MLEHVRSFQDRDMCTSLPISVQMCAAGPARWHIHQQGESPSDPARSRPDQLWRPGLLHFDLITLAICSSYMGQAKICMTLEHQSTHKVHSPTPRD